MKSGPPMTPTAFKSLVESTGEDSDVVSLAESLYQAAFTATVGTLEWMDFSGRGWDDASALRLAEVGGCQNYGPFLGPNYNTAPNI